MRHPRSRLSLITGVALFGLAINASAADLPATGVSEQDHQIHESTGVASGTVIGALVGGPIGAVAGAALGGWVGDRTAAAKERDSLAAVLEEEHQSLIALQAEYRALEARHQIALRDAEQAKKQNAELAQRSRTAQPRVFACCSDSELDLHFKTASTAIEPHYQAKLAALAKLANDLPNATVEITGHADRRGNADANLALSKQRIQAVAERLRTLGVTGTAIQTSAYGESRPVTDTDTLENNFFDRRVVVRVNYGGSSLLTRQ